MSPSLNAKLCFEKLSGRITEFDVFEGSERIVSFRFSKPKKLLEKSSIPFIARMENCTQDSFYLEILPLKDMETKNIVLDFPSYVAENNLSKIEFKKMVPLKVKFHSKTPRLYHSGRVCWNERCYRVACNVKTSKHLGISSVPITLNDEFKNTGRNLKRYTINVSSISDYPYIFLKITGKNYGDPYPRLLWIKIDNVTVSPREGDYTWPVVSEIVDDDFSYEFEVSNLLEGKEKVVVEIGLTTYRGYWLISAKFVGENVLIV
ncbi:MAG: hypothetical protein J7K98_00190 [Candidatus Aenigmarchaeota archaeon]|nr:hypothetical protein [Candidatus Aenigmarchaeota archaeon]